MFRKTLGVSDGGGKLAHDLILQLWQTFKNDLTDPKRY